MMLIETAIPFLPSYFSRWETLQMSPLWLCGYPVGLAEVPPPAAPQGATQRLGSLFQFLLLWSHLYYQQSDLWNLRARQAAPIPAQPLPGQPRPNRQLRLSAQPAVMAPGSSRPTGASEGLGSSKGCWLGDSVQVSLWGDGGPLPRWNGRGLDQGVSSTEGP